MWINKKTLYRYDHDHQPDNSAGCGCERKKSVCISIAHCHDERILQGHDRHQCINEINRSQQPHQSVSASLLLHHQSDWNHHTEIQEQKKAGANPIEMYSHPLLSVSGLFFCQDNHAPDQNKYQIIYADTPGPDRTVGNTQVSVIQSKQNRHRQGTGRVKKGSAIFSEIRLYSRSTR